MMTQPPGWNFNGSATWAPGAGILTPNAQGQAGTIIYAHALDATQGFKVSFDIQLGKGDGGGFMVELQGPTAVGGSGGSLAMHGLGGLGIELDTYKNSCDADADHVGVDDLTADCAAEQGTLPSLSAFQLSQLGIQLSDGAWHTCNVGWFPGMLSVAVDGQAALNVPVPPALVGNSVWFGFAAATGAATAAQSIRNVVIAFPNQQCL